MSRQELLSSKTTATTLTQKFWMPMVMTMPWVMTLTITLGVAMI